MGGFSDVDVEAAIVDLDTVFSGELRASIVAAYFAAWRTWTRNILRYLPVCPTRTARSVVWALVLAEVRARLSDSPDVIFKETKQGHFFLIVPGGKKVKSILVRFKYLDQELHTHNYPTQTSIEYDEQMPLPGIPPGIRVSVGYRPNQDETAITGVFAVWSVGLQKLWVRELDKVAADVTPVLPITPIVKPTDQPRRTKVKDELNKDKKEDPSSEK
jgi:hypothetical protein